MSVGVTRLLLFVASIGFFQNPALAQTPASNSATPLYKFPAGKEFGYNFQLNGRVSSAAFSESGTIRYSIEGPTDELTFQGKQQTKASGTAFVVGLGGEIATCAHVVYGATSITVKLGKNEYEADLIDIDQKNDLAILRLKTSDKLPQPLNLDIGKGARLAEEVRVIGYPLADVLGNSVKVTRGTVAGFISQQDQENQIQIDASINGGNSGGPVVNDSAEVVGIASAKLTGIEVSTVGFAVPVSTLVKMLNRNGIQVSSSAEKNSLTGPQVADRVTPSVGFVSVVQGPNGIGLEQHSKLKFSGSKKSKISLPRSGGRTVPDHLQSWRNRYSMPHHRGIGGFGSRQVFDAQVSYRVLQRIELSRTKNVSRERCY